jgi:hypothetical protein
MQRKVQWSIVTEKKIGSSTYSTERKKIYLQYSAKKISIWTDLIVEDPLKMYPWVLIENREEAREYWMTYRGPDFLAVAWFGSSATPPSVSSTGNTQEDWERETTCWRERVGEEANNTMARKPSPPSIIQYSQEEAEGFSVLNCARRVSPHPSPPPPPPHTQHILLQAVELAWQCILLSLDCCMLGCSDI